MQATTNVSGCRTGLGRLIAMMASLLSSTIAGLPAYGDGPGFKSSEKLIAMRDGVISSSVGIPGEVKLPDRKRLNLQTSGLISDFGIAATEALAKSTTLDEFV
jgi:hypothetical protein